MPELTLSVEVDAPAEVTWAAITDWAGQGEWMLGTTVRATDAGTDGPGRGVGGGLWARTGFGPFGVVDTMVITAWDPPRRCEVRHTGKVVRGSAAFEVVPLGAARSRFVWTEWLELPLGPVGLLGWLVVRPAFAAGVAASLRKFAVWTEHRPALGTAV